MTGDPHDLLADYVSVPQIAEALDVGPQYVYDLADTKLPTVRVGRHVLIRRSDVVEFCALRADELRARATKFELGAVRLAA